MADGNINSTDSYLEKTSKLIPAEVLALFITMSSMVWAAATTPENVKQWVVLVVAIAVGVVAVPVALLKLKKVTGGMHLGLSVFAFFLWVFNVQHERLPRFTDYQEMETVVGSLLLVFFTFLAPLLIPDSEVKT
jgi:hypothetical protein